MSHDRYFVDRLATKIIAVGHGGIEVYPGTYAEYLWSKAQRAAAPVADPAPRRASAPTPPREKAAVKSPPPVAVASTPKASHKAATAESRKHRKAAETRDRRVLDLEARIAEKEQQVRALETKMAAPDFYQDRTEAEAALRLHQSLMWDVGDLMNQWESLQTSEPVE